VAKLKHQFSLLHKSSKTLTVPREPELQTLLRAQDRKANGGSASSGSIDKQKQKGCSFSLHQLNKKVSISMHWILQRLTSRSFNFFT
ncbi:hypothetical protein M569_08280, partial [Genlisea aurea]